MSANGDPRRTDTAARLIKASPDRIYQAFASADSLMQWLPPAGMSGRALEYDFQEGGGYRIELRYDDALPVDRGKTTQQTDVTSGRFLELLPGRRVRQSVEFQSDDPAFTGDMRMTWSFDPAVEGTRVTVTVDDVPNGIRKADHDEGLRSSLDNLAAFVEHPLMD
jgi:uncharacterized protein YndB with AHSA1/START domain